MPRNDEPRVLNISFGEYIGPRLTGQWGEGYTQAELDDAQARYDLVFPPDLVALYRERRPLDSFDWRKDDDIIRDRLEWPLEGLWFDVEHNGLWWPDWGERPTDPTAQKEVLRAVVAKAPRLIPLYGHRYIPAEPHEVGNPVFSVYQSDIVYYGMNLADYFEREFGDPRAKPWGPIKRIRFWSDMVDRPYRDPFYPFKPPLPPPLLPGR